VLKVTAIYGVVDTGSVLHYVLLSLNWTVRSSDGLLLDWECKNYIKLCHIL